MITSGVPRFTALDTLLTNLYTKNLDAKDCDFLKFPDGTVISIPNQIFANCKQNIETSNGRVLPFHIRLSKTNC